MMVLSLFIIGHMGLFFYNKIGSIISIVDLPTTNIIEPESSSFLLLKIKTLPLNYYS
ncbi:DNA polymerase IV [Streptococcus pneumoniae]|nr:DNA polymerase IV [Streptococcus pneumoniae]TLP81525.1 DNA polymerase IV [Streptococcus pneumoniae]